MDKEPTNPGPGEGDEETSWTFFHDRTAMEAPAGWVDDSIVRLTYMPGGQNPPNIVVSRDRVGAKEPLSAYAARNLKGLEKGFAGLKVRHQGPATHAGFKEAYALTYSWTLPGGKVLVQQQLILRVLEQKVYVLYGTCRAEDHARWRPELEQAFASFHLHDPGAEGGA